MNDDVLAGLILVILLEMERNSMDPTERARWQNFLSNLRYELRLLQNEAGGGLLYDHAEQLIQDIEREHDSLRGGTPTE